MRKVEDSKPRLESVRPGREPEPVSFELNTIFYKMKIDQQNNNNLPFFVIKTEYRDPLVQKLTDIISYYETQAKNFVYETAAFFNASLIGTPPFLQSPKIELDDLPEYTTMLQDLIKNINEYLRGENPPKSSIRINFKHLYKTVACKLRNPRADHNKTALKVKFLGLMGKIKICNSDHTLKARILHIQPSNIAPPLPLPISLSDSQASANDCRRGVYKLNFKEGDLGKFLRGLVKI